jgi:hypothetical protein
MARLLSAFDVYVGVDQTGAVHGTGLKKGLPKPLPTSILFKNTLYTGLFLPAFNDVEIKALVASTVPVKNSKIFVAVDAVLGLPEECRVPFHQIIEKTKRYQATRRRRKELAYGREAAFDFFLQFLEPGLRKHVEVKGRAVTPFRLPERRCERLANANSVFNRVPAQRNIGCGTYRILCDLAAGSNENQQRFLVWPHQPNLNSSKTNMVISETYPSLMWKILGISRTRNESDFYSFCKSELTIVSRKKVSADHIDAAVSAIGARYLIEEKKYFQAVAGPDFGREGWILGLDYKKKE